MGQDILAFCKSITSGDSEYVQIVGGQAFFTIQGFDDDPAMTQSTFHRFWLVASDPTAVFTNGNYFGTPRDIMAGLDGGFDKPFQVLAKTPLWSASVKEVYDSTGEIANFSLQGSHKYQIPKRILDLVNKHLQRASQNFDETEPKLWLIAEYHAESGMSVSLFSRIEVQFTRHKAGFRI